MAKVTLPLTASSKLANVELGTEPIGINPFANQGVTAEEAPVLLALESKQTVDAESFAAKMVKSGGQGTLAQARLFVNAGLSVIEDLVDEYGAVTVQTPMGTIETFISGIMENAQDQPDPAKNYAFLALVVPETYRKLFAKIETYVPTEVCPATLKRVRDKATNAKGICGAKAFYLEGRGMTIGSTGEKLELLNPLTLAKVADVAVDATSKSTVQFTCTLPATTAIAAGPYVLRLTTLAGGLVPWPLDLEVTLLEPVAPLVPTITKVTQTTDGAPDGKISYLDERARLYIQNMPGIENPENEISVTWTKRDSSTIVKGRSQIDFLDVSNGYIKPEVPEDLAVGDRLTVKATYNGVDTNVKTVTVV